MASSLQLLIEEINFQRNKEMKQSLREDSAGFVVLQGTTFWTDLFVRHFLFETDCSIDCDDLLFFVRKKHIKSSSRDLPKYETEIDVFRKDSRKLPIGDPEINWEETVYLNLIIHQFDYKLTLAICTRTSPKELQVLRRHTQKVYASPSRRKMNTKGECEEITYPFICFMVENYDEVFENIMVRDGEMVCVELVANDKDGTVQGVTFLGSIRYDALKKVYDARQSSLSSKVAQRMTFGMFGTSASPSTRCEFVRMKGPQGKGHAEMAVTKPKGSGIETPTSEPGFCAIDCNNDWDDQDADGFFNYRHQRRLSDPSANLNDFNKYGFRTKPTQDIGSKARSENEGLDSLAHELTEIEAGDLHDDCPRPTNTNQRTRDIAMSTSLSTATTMEGNCVGGAQNDLAAFNTCSSRSLADNHKTQSGLETGVREEVERASEYDYYEMADDAFHIDDEAGTDVEEDFIKIGYFKSLKPSKGDAPHNGVVELPSQPTRDMRLPEKERRHREVYSTWPTARTRSRNQSEALVLVRNSIKMLTQLPKKTTADGTNIYYWCDQRKELDDGAFNPLWATKGFTQTFHFWKENRRQSSTPLNAFLTYVSLPWWSIAKDLLDHRETPILTF